MASYNKVILVGNLTRDPELAYTPSNTPVCKFGLAVNRKWRDANGQSKEEVCFVDCTTFGKSAETFNQYMAKGRPVLLEGRLHFSQWKAKDGSNRSKLDVIVERFTFLGTKQDGEQNGARTGNGGQQAESGPPDDDYPPADDSNIPF